MAAMNVGGSQRNAIVIMTRAGMGESAVSQAIQAHTA